MLPRRTLLVVAALFAAGCSGSTDFTITKNFSLNSTAGVPYSYVENADLSQESGSAWNHRDKIKSLEVVGLDATMTSRTDLNGPTTGDGTLVLSRSGVNLTIGTWTAWPIDAAPESIGVTLNKDAVWVIEDALRGDGKFTVTAAGTTGKDVSAAVTVALHMKLKYRVP